MSFTLKAAEQFNIPELLFWTASACGLVAYMQYRQLVEKGYIPLPDMSNGTNGYLDTTRCNDNPEAKNNHTQRNSKEQPFKPRPSQGYSHISQTPATSDNADSNEVLVNDEEYLENFMQNQGMVPYRMGDLLGCDVVLDEDQVLEQL
ncbi:hypothetical protein POM88_053222 [Heracleum sosnowskyi]|uniref:Uncharacterized protein n=1 Tax=Heracleum sosnowskyi TaxID=360622 RepID=A0AAD8GQT9_9APIA|nr:hypothetical protein POM88_053222 [Heracleum sosnowskyi]